MNKLALTLGISILVLTPAATSKPEVTYREFYQEDLQSGEMMTFGLQVEDSVDVDYVTATSYSDGVESDFTPLLDRNDDDFFAGSLGPVEGGNTYRIVVEACNTENECSTESFRREASCSVGLMGSCLS